jgi:phage-related protein
MLWKIEFYDRTVEANINKWPEDVMPKFLWLLNLMEKIGPDKMNASYIKTLGDGLFKINAKNDNEAGCALFCISTKDKTIIILDGLIKSSQKITPIETTLARTRMNEIRLKTL